MKINLNKITHARRKNLLLVVNQNCNYQDEQEVKENQNGRAKFNDVLPAWD